LIKLIILCASYECAFRYSISGCWHPNKQVLKITTEILSNACTNFIVVPYLIIKQIKIMHKDEDMATLIWCPYILQINNGMKVKKGKRLVAPTPRERTVLSREG
jgi:hypothetical protein